MSDPFSTRILRVLLTLSIVLEITALSSVSSPAIAQSDSSPFRVSMPIGEVVAASQVNMDGGETTNSKYSMISWNLNEITLSSEDADKASAVRGSIKWLVETQILDRDIVETWRPELARNVLSRPERYVTSVDARSDAYYIRINLVQLLRDVVTVFFGEITPRISVMTTEQILTHPRVPDPAVATAIASALLKYGFQVCDASQASEVLDRESSLQMETGDAAAMKVAMRELRADMLVIGESMAEEHTNRDGFDARVEFQVVEGTTGRVIASRTETENNVDGQSPLVAAKTALQKAAEHTTLKMVTEMLNAYGKPVTRLRVYRFRNYDDRAKIMVSLRKSLPGSIITPISMDLRATKCAVFSVETKQSVDDIASALKRISGLKLKITGIECRSIVCDLI